MRQSRYYSDGVITVSHHAPHKLRRADNHYMVECLGPFLKDSLSWKGPDFENWVDKICEARNLKRRKDKEFKITQAIRRKISASVSKMAESKQAAENLIFLTLTFPMDISEREANECWGKYAENLKLNYRLSGYVCVKELTKIGRPHFHAILKIPYQPIKKLNKAWCMTWRDKHEETPNAVRHDPDKPLIIRSIRRAVAYVAKYASKAAKDGTIYTEKCYFIDQNSLDKGTVLSDAFIDFLVSYHATGKNKGVKVWKYDKFGVEIWTLTDFYHTFDYLQPIFKDNGEENFTGLVRSQPAIIEF